MGEHTGKKARPEDDSTGTPLHTGVLFKLNSDGDAKTAEHWIQRDMFIAQNHSLCYLSKKEQSRDKKLVLIDGSKLANATFSPLDAARPFAFNCAVSDDKES